MTSPWLLKQSSGARQREGSRPLSVTQPGRMKDRLPNDQGLPGTACAAAELGAGGTSSSVPSCGISEEQHEPTVLENFRLSEELEK